MVCVAVVPASSTTGGACVAQLIALAGSCSVGGGAGAGGGGGIGIGIGGICGSRGVLGDGNGSCCGEVSCKSDFISACDEVTGRKKSDPDPDVPVDSSPVMIRACVRTEDAAEKIALRHAECHQLTFVKGINALQPSTLGSTFENAQVAVIVTPMTKEGFSKDKEATKNMIQAAAAAGVKHVIYIGSWTVLQPKSDCLFLRTVSSTVKRS